MKTFRKLFAACALALVAGCAGEGTISNSLGGGQEEADDDCSKTQGYWQNHEGWPVDSLSLGDVSYTEEELRSILEESVAGGNGLVSLAHQLIAAKLNVARGANGDDIADEIEAADDMIGGLVVPPVGDDSLETSVTSDLVEALDAFNNADSGPCETPDAPYCGDGAMDEGEACDDGNDVDGDGCTDCSVDEDEEPYCGDGAMDEGEACDDGNDVDGDGCTDCTIDEDEEPYCGDGIPDAGEACDDGNNLPGDGCSPTCTVEVPELPEQECGNGIVELGEECDDGDDDDTDSCSNDCNLQT